MKNNFKRILSLILITSFGFISACNNNNSNNNESSSTDSSQESYEEFVVDNDSLNIWLDRYEECDIKLAKGDINKLTITSNDVSVVSVENQRLIAQGKGETTVTISNGKDKVNITVKVRQSGVKPVFAFNSLEAYIGYDYELPQEISLNGNTFKTTINYEVTIEDESIAKYENNKLTGLVKGTTKATISSLYKGLTITKEYTLEVKDLLYISFSSDEINLHNVTTKLGKQELDAIVYEKGEAKTDYEIVYEITSGNDVIKIEDGIVFALKEGNATIKASFTKDNKTYTSSINVVVSANYIDTKFINTAEVPITFEETNETIAGRSGSIYKYQANKDVDGNTCWSNHICEQNNTKSIIDLYKEGKRYFAYDLYYQSNQNLMIGSGSLTSWISVGDYFRKDYIKIIKDGEVTNRLEKNCWITVVYDLKALWEKNMGLSSYFFFFVNDGTTTQYLMNAKYYLDDTFIPDENLKYENKDTYYQATNDEFDVMIPISKYYSMETGQPSIVVNENEVPTYKKANETIGGRNSAYKYETKINSSLKNSLIVASSMNDSYDESMYKMSKMGNYYAFDIYPTTNSTLTFALNNQSTTASVTVDKTNVSEFENWLIVLKDGKRQNTIKKNEWQTIIYAFNDAYDDNQYSASLTFSVNNENSIVYIDNCRYYKDNSFIPNEYEEEYIRPIVPENSLSSKISVERITSGDFKGSYKYTNKTSGEYEGDNQNWGESGIRFNGVTTKDDQVAEFFTNGYRYIKYEMYLAENVSSISLRVSADRNLTQYWMHDIKINSSIDNESIYIFNSDETLAKSLERETWYTVYIPVKYSSIDCGNTYITMYTNGGSEQKPAVAYIRYISYEDEMNTLFVRNDGAYADNVDLEYIKAEGDFKNSYKYTNKTSGEYEGNNQNWGESGVRFSKVTAKDDSESGAFFKDDYKWIKTDVYFTESVQSFTIRATGDQNMTNYWEKDIKVNSPLNGRNVYLVDNHGNRTNYLKANSWYTLYIPFEYTSPDTGWTMVSLYTNGGSLTNPSIMYLKDISFLKEADIPEAEIDDILARVDYKDEVSIEKIDDVYKYTNKTSGADEGNKQNWGESGVFFKDVTNPTALTGQESVGQFFKDGYKWIKVSINCGQMSSFSIKVLGQEGLENYLVDKIRLNEVFENKDIMYVTDINGNRVDMIKSDTWYNLYIPVKYSENYANWTDVLIYTNGGSVTNPSIMYLKDSQYLFENEVSLPDYPLIKDVNIFTRDDMKDNVSIIEDENGVYTYTNKTSGTMEGNGQNWGESGIYFAEIRDGKFFTDGYSYIKADVNFADSVSYFSLRFGQNPTNSYWIEKIEFDTPLPIGRGLYFFDSNKVKVDAISHNTWYTMFIPVADASSHNTLFTSGGSIENPAIMQLKNVSYTKEVDMTSIYPYAKSGSVTKTNNGYLITANDVAVFNGVTHSNAKSANESAGAYFKDGNNYIAFDLYANENVKAIKLSLSGETINSWTDPIAYLITVNEEVDENVVILDGNGNRVKALTNDKWYKIIVKFEYINNEGWTELTYSVIGDNGQSLINNAYYVKNYEAPEFVIPTLNASLFTRDDMKDNVSIIEDENGVYTYTNKTSGTMEGNGQNWGESGIYFTEIRDGKFFTDGYNYIKADVYFNDNVSYFTLRFGQNPTNSYWIEKIEFDTSLPIGRGIYIYDVNGLKVSSITRNTWYTMFIPVTDASCHNTLFTSGGSIENPAIMQLKNVTYTKEIDMTSIYPYAKSKSSITSDNNGYLVSSGNTILFSGVTHENASSSNESAGAFFQSNYKYISMKIYANEKVKTLDFSIVGEAIGSWTTRTISIEVNGSLNENVIVLDENNNKVDSLKNDTWYTLIIKVDYTNTTGYTEFNYQITSKSEDRADSLIKDIHMLKELNI